MLDRLDEVARQFEELTDMLSRPAIISNPAEFQKAARKRSELEPLVSKYIEYKKIHEDYLGAKALIDSGNDPDLREMAQEEVEQLKPTLSNFENELRLMLIPKDENDAKDVIFEIRAGTGGEEAALFAAQLYRMYLRYSEGKGWKCEEMSINGTGIGGLKEVVFSVQGNGAYGRLKFESGVHRVQRVPQTEASGRIHTSAATVAVLPEAEDVEVELNDDEIRVDVFRSSGPGGQSVNTTDSAVRVTHIPTGIVISCQDEKSQHKNKAKALRILKAKLLDAAHMEQDKSRAQDRKSQVGSGDRSERIRTYNFPQQRLTDHRIGLTLYSLNEIMEGELDPVVERLIEADQLKKLEAGAEG